MIWSDVHTTLLDTDDYFDDVCGATWRHHTHKMFVVENTSPWPKKWEARG